MKMDKVAGSGNDEFYTPVYAITPLIKYLKDKGLRKYYVLLTPKIVRFIRCYYQKVLK